MGFGRILAWFVGDKAILGAGALGMECRALLEPERTNGRQGWVVGGHVVPQDVHITPERMLE